VLATIEDDTDSDGLPDTWEQQFGVAAGSAAGDDGPGGDPDQDGATNLEEYLAGTHPRGFAEFTRYFAEGAAGGGMAFQCRFGLTNPSPTALAHVLLRFLRSDGTSQSHRLLLPPQSEKTVEASQVLGTGFAEFATVVEADILVVADRTMRWTDLEYGGHAETGIKQYATKWYLAEGATHSGFDLFYLLQNPSTARADVTVTYLLPAPRPPIVKKYTVLARSRANIWVDLEAPGLANTDVSAIIEGVPIIVERAMYLSTARSFEAAHESAGILAPATRWFLAEGATGDFFDLFVLIANPEPSTALVRGTYYLPDGQTLVKDYAVAANSRFNIWVDLEEFPDGSGNRRLADTAVSMVFESLNGVGVIVERSMWWPGPTAATWAEAHNTPGTTETGEAWAMGDGEVGGHCQAETYILIANTSPIAGPVRVTLLFEGGRAPVSRTFDLLPSSRFNVAVGTLFPEAIDQRFGAIVEGVGSPALALVVEHAAYWNAPAADGTSCFWAAGTDAIATRLR
jgi:hypothetical protein